MAFDRYYFPFDTSNPLPAVSPAFGSQWDTTDAAIRVPIGNNKPGSATTAQHSVSSMGYGQRGLIAQGITDVTAGGTLSGRVRAAYHAWQADADGDCYLTLTLRVVSSDGTVERGVLIYAVDSSQELDTSDTVRTIPVTELNPVEAMIGDRIVIELGIVRGNGAATPSSSALIELSSSHLASDVSYVDGVDSDLVGWVDIEFDSGPPASTGPVLIPPVVGVLTVSSFLGMVGTFTGYVSNPTIDRAPASLLVYISGATGRSSLAAEIDGTELARVQIADDGTGAITIPITAANGDAGVHEVDLIQYVGGAGKFVKVTVNYEVIRAPALLPVPLPPDEPAVPVPARGSKWVFQDLAPGGLGSYVLPVSPATHTPPQYEHSFTSRHAKAKTGQFHIFQAAGVVKEWTFSGYAPTEEMVEKLWAYRELNRRIYIIDHHGRAWKVAITNLDVKPRLRHWWNDDPTDWGSDWEMTVTVLDQDPVTI